MSATSAQPALTRASLLQGVSVLAARDRQFARIVTDYGPLYRKFELRFDGMPTAERVAKAGEPALHAVGFTRQKARYVAGLATQLADGRVSLRRIARLPDAEAAAALVEINGVGPWTAGVYLLMALRRPDVWPPGDLGLHKSLAEVRHLPQVPSSDEAAEFAHRWRPWRAVAARLLWHSYLGRRRKSWQPT
jgi:DNA-3-methyladenine glycosylase II